MNKDRPLTFDLGNAADAERFEKLRPPSGSPFTATYTLQFVEIEKAGRMRSERLEQYRTALSRQLAIVERLIAKAGGAHIILAMPGDHPTPHIFDRALAEADRIIQNAIAEPLADAGEKANAEQKKRAANPRLPEKISQIITRLSKGDGEPKELWEGFVRSIERAGLNPSEQLTPAGDLQVFYDVENKDTKSKRQMEPKTKNMTFRTFRQHLGKARKRTSAR